MEIPNLNMMEVVDFEKDTGAQLPVAMEGEGRTIIELSNNEAEEQHTF